MRKEPVEIGGLYAVTPDTSDTKRLCRQVEAVLHGGARMVQYRSKAEDQELKRVQGRGLIALCRRYRALFIVNDDVDLAHELGADGVHLGRDDVSVRSARAILGRRLVGVSCYDSLPTAAEAQDAGADYVAFGSFFPSSVKPGAVRAPVGLLKAARARLRLPIVAIGGITPDNARALIEAGADAVAVISSLFDDPDPATVARAFVQSFEAQRMHPSIGSCL